MSFLSLSYREILAIFVCVLGFVFFAYTFNRHRRQPTPTSRILIEFSLFIIILSVYLLEDDIISMLGVNTSNPISKHIVDAVSWLAFAYLLLRAVNIFVWEGMLSQDGELLIPKFLIHMTNFLILLVIFILFVFFVLDQNVTALAASAGALMLGVGYLAKVPLESIFAALSFSLAPMFKKGDTISFLAPQLGETIGTVKDIGWLHVIVRTNDGCLVYIHNLIIERGLIKNFSYPDRKPCYITDVTLEYEFPLNKAYDLINSALIELSDIVAKFVVTTNEFTRFGVTYRIKFWMEDKYAYTDTLHAVHSSIYYKVQREKNLDFGYDKFNSMHASKISDKRRATHQTARDALILSVEERISHLRNVDFLESLSEEEISTLSQNSIPRGFGPPEKIITQGSAGDSMFVIVKGSVRIYLGTQNNETIELATRGPGQYFGEMSLLTGEPRGANVTALNDVVVLEIPKEALRKTLEEQPSLVRNIANSVAKMKAENLSASEAYERSLNEKTSENSTNIIRLALLKFFGLNDSES